MFFCSACTTKYYSYHMWNSFESSKERDLKNKTIKFVGNDVAIGNKFIESLSVYGLKKFDEKKKKNPDFIATTVYDVSSVQGYRNVPMYGPTGINSINTNSYGTFSRGINYGSYDYSGYSHSMVNYNYGITGYQVVPYVSYTTHIMFNVRKYEPKKNFEQMRSCYFSTLYVSDIVHKYDMLNYLLVSTENFGFMKEREYISLDCYYDEYRDKYICQEPRGIITNIIDMFKGE